MEEEKVKALQKLLEVVEDEEFLRKLRIFWHRFQKVPDDEISGMSAWGLGLHLKLLLIAFRGLPESLKRRIEELQAASKEAEG